MELDMPKFKTRGYLPRNQRGYVVGESHHRARLSDADIDLIHELKAAGLSCSAIARKFDDLEPPPSKSTIRDILAGRRRSQVPTVWAPAKRPKRKG